ncbi:MAG TPA: hypothetical protein VJX67_14830, partial [Blastocatellia bacterium]|nr:hypothetical protein [Blastocatellia bacterium]
MKSESQPAPHFESETLIVILDGKGRILSSSHRPRNGQNEAESFNGKYFWEVFLTPDKMDRFKGALSRKKNKSDSFRFESLCPALNGD